MREELATHIKGVRKQREAKRARFIACHLLLQALLHSKHVSLSLLLQDLQEIKDTNEEEEEEHLT